jgi:acyl-coenzyme A thioesterase PaaI-like protein
MPTAALKMTIADLEAFLSTEFPQAIDMAAITALEPGRVQCRSRTNTADLRPGGTLSGPTMMALVDLTAYLLVLASIGPVALAVTSHLSIHFLRKPQPGDLLATAALLRLSRRQLVCAVEVHSDGEPDPVAHATVTYAIPA